MYIDHLLNKTVIKQTTYWNKPLIGTINVSISGACSRSSNDNVPCPLQEQLNLSHCILIQVRSPILQAHESLITLDIGAFGKKKKNQIKGKKLQRLKSVMTRISLHKI